MKERETSSVTCVVAEIWSGSAPIRVATRASTGVLVMMLPIRLSRLASDSKPVSEAGRRAGGTSIAACVTAAAGCSWRIEIPGGKRLMLARFDSVAIAATTVAITAKAISLRRRARAGFGPRVGIGKRAERG